MTPSVTDTQAQSAAEIKALLDLFPPLRLRYCLLTPTAVQEAFLRLADKEVFYGGGAGGGKSAALLMAALQYADVPGYNALMLRPSAAEFQLAGGLIDLANRWLAGTKARWNGEQRTWRFPGAGRAGSDGASLTFGYLATEDDISRYAGASYSFLGFDELTRFDEQHYRRMFRALRQPAATSELGGARDGTRLTDVPVRVRSTSNPGGPGHTWVKDRFVNPASRHSDSVFLPSRLADNPHLDQQTYIATLGELPTAERERLLHGDWEIPDDGELFQRDWFPLIEPHQLPSDGINAVRYWDLAATEPSSRNRDPDWTVGLLLYSQRKSGMFCIADIVRERKAPGAIEQLVAATAKRDGRNVHIRLEQEPGAAGVAAIDRYKRHVLKGYSVRAERVTGEKATRAWPVAAAAENGLIRLVRGRHSSAFLDELASFPHGKSRQRGGRRTARNTLGLPNPSTRKKGQAGIRYGIDPEREEGEGSLLVALVSICHPYRVRLGVVLMVLSLVLAAPAAAHTRGGYWPVAKVMRALDGERIRVGSKRVRVDSATSLCSGERRVKRRGGVRTWTHFRCTFSTFTASGPGRDAEFRVHVLGPRRIGISGARWIAG